MGGPKQLNVGDKGHVYLNPVVHGIRRSYNPLWLGISLFVAFITHCLKNDELSGSKPRRTRAVGT